MANSLSALNPTYFKNTIQDYLNNMMVGMPISNRKCEALLTDGQAVDFPYINDVRVQSYTQGTDLTADALTAVSDTLTVNQSKVALFVVDPVQEKQAKADYPITLSKQCAYVIGNEMDQNLLAAGVAGATDTVTGGALTTATLLSKMADSRAELARNNAQGDYFYVLDPERISLLAQTFISNGFQVGDKTLVNGFAGRAMGFDIYESNNLAYSVTLTVDTIPTAAETITVAGVEWTLIADGGTCAAGEMKIGGDVADFKTIFVAAINGATAPTAGDYLDVATADRRKYQNMQVSAATFGGDDCVITAYGKIAGSETMAVATNIFGTETSNALCGVKGAISLALQMTPELYVREEPLQLATNYMVHHLYGSTVFTRDAARLVKLSFNV